MDQQAVEIKNKKKTAPTPQNTPINTDLINSQFNSTIPIITEEDMESNGHFIVEALPASVQRRINGLKYFQSKHTELEGKFQEEVLALEKKYLELYRPLYTKRAEVVSGKYEPTEEEVTLGAKVDQEEDGELIEKPTAAEDEEPDNITGVPGFWSTVLKTHPQISDTISEQDEEVLEHLVDIRLTYLETPGFLLEFEFSENEFFTNTVLTKTYHYQDSVSHGDFVYDRAEGCVIQWKEGKDLTVAVETKKQRHKGTNKTRVVKRTVPADTFFHFFSPPTVPEEDAELDEEEAEGLDAKLEADYELGEEFKEKIIPLAVDFFTGKALDYEDYDDEFDDFVSDEDDEDDEEEDSEETEDDDTDAQPAKGENAPECKQS